ncbi:hypothetical protein ACQZV8_00020 [Magnetococcales bacterium HHB-1]
MGSDFMFKLFSKSKDSPREKQKEKKQLIIQLSPVGWKSWLRNTATAKELNTEQGDFDKPAENDHLQWEQMVQSAARKLKADLAEADKVSLILDDNSIQYSDNKPPLIQEHNETEVRKYGLRLLNQKSTDDVVFGQMPFATPEGESRTSNLLYAFATQHQIKAQKSIWGPQTEAIIPFPTLLMQKSAANPTQTYAAFILGGYSSSVLLINHKLGALLVRTIPSGLFSILKAVAEETKTNIKEAKKAIIGKRLQLDKIVPIPPGDHAPPNIVHLNDLEIALCRELTTLQQGIKESWSFFSHQRGIPSPEQFEIFGPHDQLQGLIPWLSEHAGITITEDKIDILHALSTDQIPCNLFSPEIKLAQAGHIESSNPLAKRRNQMPGAGRRRRGGKRGAVKKNRRRNAADEKKEGFFSKLFAESEGTKTAESGEPTSDRNYFFMFGFFVFALLYWAYEEYALVEQKYSNNANALIASRTMNDTFHKANQVQAKPVVILDETMTRVLWTEKFLALSQLIDEHIWLTDVSLESENRNIGGTQVLSKKLVVKGSVLPSTKGHIETIAKFLQRIVKDKKRFMADFREELTFPGAVLDENDETGHDLVHFTFEAWYDKNKRILSLTGEEEEDDGSGGEKKKDGLGLGAMQSNIRKANQDRQQFLPGGR